MKYRENHLHAQTHTETDPPPHLYSHILNHTDKSPMAPCRVRPPLPRWAVHSFITLRESVSAIYSAEQDAACLNSCPVVTPAATSHMQFSIHCPLMQLERN